MVNKLFEHIGTKVVLANPWLDTYSVNCIEIPFSNGEKRIVNFEGDEKEDLSINDISGNGFYIKINPRFTYTEQRQLSSDKRDFLVSIRFRFVFFGINTEIEYSKMGLENKFATAFRNISFSDYIGNERSIKLNISQTNTDALQIFKEEVGKDYDFGAESVFVALDGTLSFISTDNYCDSECGIAVSESTLKTLDFCDPAIIALLNAKQRACLEEEFGGGGSFDCSELAGCQLIQEIQNSISQEVTDRTNADNTLQSAISQEVTDRQNAGIYLENYIDQVSNDLSLHSIDTNNPHQTTLEQARSQNSSLSGDINANTNGIINLRDAVAPQEPITKSQFDSYNASVGRQRGSIDCSANPNYPASNVGDRWDVTVAGKIGGASGIDVQIYDEIVCKTQSVAGDQATVGMNFYVVQGNLERASETVSGYTQYASDAEVQAGTENTKTFTPLKLTNWWTYIKGLAITWSQKQTFTTAPRLSSTTANQRLEVDANKDIISVAKGTADNKDFGTGSGTVCEGNDSRLSNSRGRKLFAYDNTTYTYTGSTGDNILRTIPIPADTMGVNSVLEIFANFTKIGTAGNPAYILYLGTSAVALSGGNVIQYILPGATSLQSGIWCRLVNKNSQSSQNTKGISQVAANPQVSQTIPSVSRSFDFTTQLYLHIYATGANASDTQGILDYQVYIDNP